MERETKIRNEKCKIKDQVARCIHSITCSFSLFRSDYGLPEEEWDYTGKYMIVFTFGRGAKVEALSNFIDSKGVKKRIIFAEYKLF
jgi:hypothetical protein